MKIILSRKGFDSSNGGCPSPILPDGTLLSMPIPSSNDKDTFADLCYNGEKYSDILNQLSPKRAFTKCHVDPDIRDNNRISPINGWKPAFGQCDAAQGMLANAKVEKGDIFLFFGWFRKTEIYNGSYRYISRKTGDFFDHADLHVIYGYMQVGDILTDINDISKYYWHPHSYYTKVPNNALYIPSQTLSFNSKYKGYGILDFRKERVLTMKDKSRSIWNDLPFLKPEHVYGNRKNSAKNEGLSYRGIWQELVIDESDGLIDWVKSIIL
ncbi:hypothetical protein [Ruminococcus sp. HUN007]|uniref:Nmad3 family putative nucleotide modification protein n=1 Tax=Ruminococcus sp. HUN007 TaxID=1514668 RepID=UPI0005D25878|nr:hypothetical protein [Ruminococcus sp. HUN007]